MLHQLGIKNNFLVVKKIFSKLGYATLIRNMFCKRGSVVKKQKHLWILSKLGYFVPILFMRNINGFFFSSNCFLFKDSQSRQIL